VAVEVIGLGAGSVDYVNLLPAVPRAAGEYAKLRISSHFVSCGGQVATALATVRALGLSARYLGPVGNDANGARIRDELQRLDVDVSTVIVREAANQFAVILVDETTGERIVLWDRDHRLTLADADIDAGLFTSARVLHVDDVDEGAAIRGARLAASQGVLVTSDLDRVTERTPELVASVTVPIFAEHVPAALTGETDPERALRKIRRQHAGLLCVTLGTAGAMALDGDCLVHEPAFAIDAVDTTGAGDVFRGAFICGQVAAWPLRRVLQFANAAAAKSCTRLGAIAGIPSLGEVEHLVAHGARRTP
jgi:sugar/nucleoside kinase (ribokinase family)